MSSLYYPLHAHCAQGSVGDSILRIKDYVKRAHDFGLDSLALTDHGSMSAMYSFINECKKYNIKPIIGMEAYEVDDASNKDKDNKQRRYHLILLAKNEQGLSNLIAIHNIAAVDGFYYKPRTDLATLKKFGKGIIGLSACVAGRIPQAIVRNEPEKAIRAINNYKACFDEFYLEIQPGKFHEQIIVNNAIIELSQFTDTPIVATNDIHYLNQEDAVAHNAHVMLGRRSYNQDVNKLIYPDNCYWFMDRDTCFNTFIRTEYITEDIINQAIDNTAHIANECSVELSSKLNMPVYTTNKSEKAMLYNMCYKKLNSIIQDKSEPEKYTDRLERELKVIDQLGFCGYFVIVQDYINWAKSNDIAVGPGRGSAAGSLVSYLLGISKADPIKYGLMFERFLDPQRAAIADIDTDFEPPKRDLLFKYAVDKYGYNNCALVSTFHIRKAKGAIRDAARVLKYKPAIGDSIAKLIPDVSYDDSGEKTTDLSIKASLEVTPELQQMYKEYQDIFDLAMKIEGVPSSVSLHAAGCLISPVSLTDKIPLIRPNKEGVLATSLDLDGAENNFVKFDFLGLSYLEIVHNTEKDIGMNFNYEDENILNDKEVWKMIGSKHTTGIFQIASKTYQERMWRLRPQTIEELAACLALIRGPCISTKLDEKYMRILEKKDTVEYLCDEYNNPTKETFGIPIFQEQIMKIFVNFDFPLSVGYSFIKSAAKKKIDKLKAYRGDFLKHAADKHINQTLAKQIFNVLEKSGAYSFNKSHAVSYALLSYASAYLKYHYPLYYMKNLLTAAFEKQQKDLYKSLLNECRYLGISFLPLDINKSDWSFTVEDGKIRIGFCALKGLGEKSFNHIKELRPFVSLEDLLDKVQARLFNKTAVNVSIFSGAFDSFIDDDKYKDRFDMFTSRYKKEIPDTIKMAGETVDILRLNNKRNYAKIEELLLGVNFIYAPENNIHSFDWNRVDNKTMFKCCSVIKSVSKKSPACINLITGNGPIKGYLLPSIQVRLEPVIKNIKKNNQYKIIAVKKDDDSCYLQDIEAIA